MTMRLPIQLQISSSSPVQTGLLQRQCTQCSEKDKLLQRQTVNQSEVSDVPPIVHEVLQSLGQPLDATTRTFMESRFGHDFSQVRVHTDTKAAEAAEAVNARAYTVGQNVVFGAGQYTLDTTIGKKLLAHELTHTIQQGNQNPAYQSELQIGSTSDPAEAVADKMGHAIATSEMAPTTLPFTPSPVASSAPVLQRDPLPDIPDLRLRPSPEIARTMGMGLLDNFALDMAELTEEHRTQLAELAPTLIDLVAAYPGGLIEITGYTDASGSEQHNQALGQRRADTIKAALVAAGVPTTAIITYSGGESEMLVPTQIPEPRNRRVQIRFEPEPLRFFRRTPGFTLELNLERPTPVQPPPPPPARPNLFPRIEPRPETPEERLDRILRERPPSLSPQPGRSFNDVFWGFVDDSLNDVMDDLGIRSEFVRERIRDGAHAAINRGIEAGLDEIMDAADLEGEAQEAIRTTVDALRDYRPGSTPGSGSR